MSSEMDRGEVVFRRFRRLLVRRWWIPVAVGILVGFLLGATSRTTYHASATVGAIQGNSVLQSAGFEPEVISQAIPLSVDAAAAAGDDFEDVVSTAVGDSVSASLVTSTCPRTITVTNCQETIDIVVVTDSPDSARDARAMYVDAITNSRTVRFEAIIDSLSRQQATKRALMEKRLTELDAQLSGLSDTSSTLAFALVADRSRISESLIDVQSAAAALESLGVEPSEVFSLSGDPTVRSMADRNVKVVAGVSFGVLIGLAVLYAMAVLDRRIRSRCDLTSAGFDMIAAVPRGPSSTELDRLARLLLAQARRKGAAVVQILPTDNDPLIGDLVASAAAAIENAQPAITVHVLRALDTDPHTLTDDGLFVVATRYGDTKSGDVERLAADLAVAGRTNGGAVLVDVPLSEFAWAISCNVDELPGSD